jgi:hypothetical protein
MGDRGTPACCIRTNAPGSTGAIGNRITNLNNETKEKEKKKKQKNQKNHVHRHSMNRPPGAEE